MEALAICTGAPTVHFEYNTICISVVGYNTVNPIVKHIDIPVYFLQEQFDNGLFIPKYDNYSVISADMCTKPWSGPIIIWYAKRMTGFILYTTREKEHYQIMRLHEFIVN